MSSTATPTASPSAQAGSAAPLATSQQAQGDQQGAQEGARESSAPPAPPASAASALAQPDANVAATVPASATAPGEAPAASAQAQAPSAPGVDMQQMIDSVRATVELAARQGSAQARISLQPQELGDMRIHLSQTSEGLVARVTAETAAGAQALNGARGELHESLSSLGVSLLRLDIGSFGSWQQGAREGALDTGGGRSQGSGSPAGEDERAAEAAADEQQATEATGTPRGGLVDVLA